MNTIKQSAQWLRRWMRKHWIISALVLVFALWRGFWWVVNTPIRNPWPKEAITIRGRFPFDQGYELMFNQNAYGKADWHQRLCSGGIFYLLGYKASTATCSGGKFWTKPLQIDAQHYEVTLYRDAYLSSWQEWTANTWHTQFKAGTDYTKILVTDYGAPENSACDGSVAALKKRNNRLFCMPQHTHKDYKDLVITEGQPKGAAERIQNFWLETELDQILPKAR